MILTHLPAPTRDYTRPEPPAQPAPSQAIISIGADSQVPPYGSAERLHYRPRRQDDFGDGGEEVPWCTAVQLSACRASPQHTPAQCAAESVCLDLWTFALHPAHQTPVGLCSRSFICNNIPSTAEQRQQSVATLQVPSQRSRCPSIRWTWARRMGPRAAPRWQCP